MKTLTRDQALRMHVRLSIVADSNLTVDPCARCKGSPLLQSINVSTGVSACTACSRGSYYGATGVF